MNSSLPSTKEESVMMKEVNGLIGNNKNNEVEVEQ